MNKKLTNNTDAIVSTANKAQVKSYLHAASELEHDIYTLEQSIEDLNETIKLLEVKPKIVMDDEYLKDGIFTNDVSYFDNPNIYRRGYDFDFDSKIPNDKKYSGMRYKKLCVTENQKYIEEKTIAIPQEPYYRAEQDLVPIRAKTPFNGNRKDYNPSIAGFGCGGTIVGAIIGLILFGVIVDSTYSIALGLVAMGIFTISPILIGLSWRSSERDRVYNERLAEHEKAYQNYKSGVVQQNKNIEAQNQKIRLENSLKRAQYQKEMDEYNKKADEIKRDYEDNLARAEIFKQQIAEIKKSLEKMYKQRDTFYAVDVVPRDFRTMDAVFMLASYYDNRLVDSLREAILMYKEDTFKKHVLVGMQNIAENINELQSTMSSVCNAIHTTNLKISDMNRNLYGISNNIIQNNRQTELLGERTKLLYEETKLGRYANEAMARNARLISEHCSELNDRHKSDSERFNKLLDELDD